MELGHLGVWCSQFRTKDDDAARAAAVDLEALGVGALWIPGGAGGDLMGDVRRVLDATDRLVVATGILNIWMHDAEQVARERADLDADFPGRLLLGLGVSHAALIDRQTPGTYRRPVAMMVEYLDQLDAADPPVPVEGRLLAALGPKMLELARTRSAGAHPYFTDPTHTARARAALGPGPLLAPEQMVVVDDDPARACAVARLHVQRYLTLPNYANNLERLGYTGDDLAAGGSERLLQGIVAMGGAAEIGARAQAHLDAGADHVCLQVLIDDRGRFPVDEWRALAALWHPAE